MKLTILGSGTSVPHPHRASPAFWLETSGGSVLLDIGPDAPHRMAQQLLDWPNLNTIWISHFHLDHFGGLAPFLFGMRWAPQTQTRTKDLRIVGPEGLRDLLTAINDANNYRLFSQPFRVEVIEVGPAKEFQMLPGITATSLKTPHTKESLALRLKDQNGKTFFYTSDTGFAKELSEFGRGVDLLLLECSFRRNKPLPTHLELAEAMQLAQESCPKKLVLTHLYPEWDNIDVATEANLLWPGAVIEATDGLLIEI
jgi:ribonuclease BN (tRNA processing enzyme)